MYVVKTKCFVMLVKKNHNYAFGFTVYKLIKYDNWFAGVLGYYSERPSSAGRAIRHEFNNRPHIYIYIILYIRSKFLNLSLMSFDRGQLDN